jgi:microcystin-dependent protein
VTGAITCGTTCVVTPTIQITTGAAAGCILTSDSGGTAIWCSPASGGINWTGTTANGIATYVDSTHICSQPNMTFDGSTLLFNNSANKVISMGCTTDINNMKCLIICGEWGCGAGACNGNYQKGIYICAGTVSGECGAYGGVISLCGANICTYTQAATNYCDRLGGSISLYGGNLRTNKNSGGMVQGGYINVCAGLAHSVSGGSHCGGYINIIGGNVCSSGGTGGVVCVAGGCSYGSCYGSGGNLCMWGGRGGQHGGCVCLFGGAGTKCCGGKVWITGGAGCTYAGDIAIAGGYGCSTASPATSCGGIVCICGGAGYACGVAISNGYGGDVCLIGGCGFTDKADNYVYGGTVTLCGGMACSAGMTGVTCVGGNVNLRGGNGGTVGHINLYYGPSTLSLSTESYGISTPTILISNRSGSGAVAGAYFNASGCIVSGSTIPVGTILPYAGSVAPTGYLLATGAAVSRTGATAALFAVIGTTYGVGDGVNTFNIPDLRGIFMKGCGTSSKLCNANATAFSGTLGGYCNDMTQGHKHYINSSGEHYHTCYDNTFCSGWWTAMNSCAGWAAGRFCCATGPLNSGAHVHDNTDFSATEYTDCTNGTPRTGADTHPASLTINYIIKY